MIYYWRFAFFTLLCFQLSSAVPQNTSSRIIVESGGNVPFNVNSLKKYSDGIGLANWTRLLVSFLDTTDLGDTTTATWKLEVKANTDKMYGDYGETLNLDYIEVTINAIEPLDGSPVFTGIIKNVYPITDGFQSLIEVAPQGKYRITISYNLGTNAKLLGHPPDYYFVDLYFDISKWAD